MVAQTEQLAFPISEKANPAWLVRDGIPSLRDWLNDRTADAEGPAGPPAPVHANPYRRDGWAPGTRPKPDYRLYPHAWVVRDLLSVLSTSGQEGYGDLLTSRRNGDPIDLRDMQALIDSAASALRFEDDDQTRPLPVPPQGGEPRTPSVAIEPRTTGEPVDERFDRLAAIAEERS